MNVFAQVDLADTLGTPWGQTLGVGNIVTLLLAGGITIAGIILLFLLLGGAFMVITSAGSNDAKGAAAGKQAITYALIGFIIVFTTYWIIRLIELIIGVNIFTAPGFVPGTGGGGN